MEEKIDLMKSYIDSMHDQIVNSIELKNNDLIFHYASLQYSNMQNREYYKNHCIFSMCDVIFKNIDVPYVEIKRKNKQKTKISRYDLEQFLILMERKKFIIQTLYYLY